MNKYDLIDAILTRLNGLEVRGIANCSALCDACNKLAALEDLLRAEEKGEDTDGTVCA